MPNFPPIRFDDMALWQAVALYGLLAAPIVWLGVRSMTAMDPIRKWASVALRLDLLMFLVLILAGAKFNREVKDLTVVAVRDVSESVDSVTGPGGEDVQHAVTRTIAQQAKIKPSQDRLGVVSFDAAARIDAFPAERYAERSAAIRTPAGGTNVAQALQLAMATMPMDTLHRIVLFWDGNATTGDLDAVARSAASQHIPIDVIPLNYDVRSEIAVDQLIAPPTRGDREPFTLSVTIRSKNPTDTPAKLTLTDNDIPVDLDRFTPGVQATRSIVLKPGPNVQHVAIPASPGGAHRFRASVETDGAADTITANNHAQAVTLIRGGGRVLFVDGGSDGRARPLAESLKRSGMLSGDDVIEAAAFPTSLLALQSFDAIVLANVSRDPGGLDIAADEMLARYVRELGGGLVVVGGPQSLGAGGWTGSEVEKVLPVDCEPPATRVMPAGALVLVIDHSGSMAGEVPGSPMNKQQIANEAAVLSLQTLWRGDLAGVIAFDGAPSWVVPLAKNSEPQKSANAVRKITPAGGTNIYPALVEAYRELAKITPDVAAVRHILLLTDGQSTPGDYNEIVGRIRKAGITLSTIGVGADADQVLLASLAQQGGGRAYPVVDPRQLPQVFVKEARTLRATLIRERAFVPRRVDASSSAVAGIEAFPPLRGMIATWPKRSVNVQLPLVDDTGSPVLAHWRVGTGQALVFTSDGGSRWADAWAGSPLFDKFWSQAVRTVARPAGSSAAEATITPLPGGRAKIVVEAVGHDGRFRNFLGVAATIVGPGADAPSQNVRLRQTAPGAYEGEFETPQDGAYLGLIRLADQKGDAGWLAAAHVAGASSELNDLQSNDTAVAELAMRTGGRVLRPFDPRENFFDRASLDRRFTALPITHWLVYAALATLLLDVAVRRFAWDRRSFAGMPTAFAAFVRTRTAGTKVESAESVAALRKIRAAAEAARDTRPAVATPSRPPAAAPPIVKMPAPAAPPPTPDHTESAGEDSLDRLAAAKRRARGRLN